MNKRFAFAAPLAIAAALTLSACGGEEEPAVTSEPEVTAEVSPSPEASPEVSPSADAEVEVEVSPSVEA